MKGRFTIVRPSGRKHKADDPAARAFEDDQGEQWLLIKKRDADAESGWDAEDHPDSVKTGYEVSFTRYFYKPQPLRTLEEIRADILALEKETEGLLGEILGDRPQ